ncbi:MAG: outer membrane beta-barrel protein [Balneolales bacterium]|nr:outer membrane beta-barrel protein [Balneolales bacterium]
MNFSFLLFTSAECTMRFNRIIPAFLAIIFLIVPALNGEIKAQSAPVFMSGTVSDSETSGALLGANVALFSLPDSTLLRGATSDAEGNFSLRMVRPGEYFLRVSYVGYHAFEDTVRWSGGDPLSKIIRLRPDPAQLEELRVTALIDRVVVRGDTTAFNADAYTVNRDATVEDLISRMPGITVQNGQVEAQGEQVRRVLVDGNEFFGDDATLALRNLPAQIVQQIEVFDRMGDQARFTGFDDGSGERTLNIVTRSGIRNGQFGRAQSGYGSDDRYTGSGSYNYFSGNQRVSVLGQTNNINQINFSGEDLVGVQEAASGGRGGRGGGGWGGGRGGWGGGGATRDFMVGGQDGITQTHSFGLNYIDRMGDAFRINASYFFNSTDNVSERLSERQYTGGFAGNQIYDEFSTGSADNLNHRFNMRAEYTLSESTSFIFTPRLSFQSNDSRSVFEAITRRNGGELVNETLNDNASERSAFDLTSSLLVRHRFETPGRTLSMNVQADANNRRGDQFRSGQTFFFDSDRGDIVENQFTDSDDRGYTLGTNLTYTERMGERAQLQLSYNPSYTVSNADRSVFSRDEVSEAFDIPEPGLSNVFENQLYRHRFTTGYNARTEGNLRYNINLSYQQTLLRGNQEFPFDAQTRQLYRNLLPSATFTFNLLENGNMRLRYNTNTRTPSANQLQDVIDNTNPIQLRGGNPDLGQSYSHSVSARWRRVDPRTASSLVLFLNASYTTDTISNVTYIAGADSVLPGGIFLGSGSRFIRPENIGDSWNVRAFMFRSLVVEALRSNLNLNGGVTFNRSPAAVNQERFDTNNWTLNLGTVLSSNISPETDFRISYQASYNLVDDAIPGGLDSDYYSGTAALRVNLNPWRGLILESDTRLRHFVGLPDDFSNDFVLWNAAIGYKFLENRAAEVRFTVVDLLNQNDNINRIIEDTYIEDVRSNVLSRYAMVTFSYNFRAIQQGGRR